MWARLVKAFLFQLEKTIAELQSACGYCPSSLHYCLLAAIHLHGLLAHECVADTFRPVRCLTPRRSGRVSNKMPSSNAGARAAQLNR